MEDVVDLYAEPYDPQRPTVTFDETSKQLIGETRPPLPAQPGHAARYDSEYKRSGTRNVFLFVEPRAGGRHVVVTEQRTVQDFAYQMQWLVDARYPEAEVSRVVLDNLNPHKPASLSETFAPAEAHRLRQELEFHYTPGHGSGLNMAEIEFSVFARHCLHRRIATAATLKRELAAVEAARNAAQATINWQCTTADARVKLPRLYPSTSR
jgi:DDE superfamily endonuclease